jgi:hypothetical protein
MVTMIVAGNHGLGPPSDLPSTEAAGVDASVARLSVGGSVGTGGLRDGAVTSGAPVGGPADAGLPVAGSSVVLGVTVPGRCEEGLGLGDPVRAVGVDAGAGAAGRLGPTKNWVIAVRPLSGCLAVTTTCPAGAGGTSKLPSTSPPAGTTTPLTTTWLPKLMVTGPHRLLAQNP